MNTQQLEKSLTEMLDKDSVNFEQKELDFAMSASSVGLNKDTLFMAVGSAISGTVSGLLGRALPIGSLQGISGLPAIITGIVLKKFLFKTGALSKVAEGVLIAGVANAVSGFIPSFAQTLDGFKQVEKVEKQVEQKQELATGGVRW